MNNPVVQKSRSEWIYAKYDDNPDSQIQDTHNWKVSTELHVVWLEWQDHPYRQRLLEKQLQLFFPDNFMANGKVRTVFTGVPSLKLLTEWPQQFRVKKCVKVCLQRRIPLCTTLSFYGYTQFFLTPSHETLFSSI